MMSVPVYPLATTTWDEREYAALQRVISSGRFTNGPVVREFEAAFADHFGAGFAVIVNLGSSANLIAVVAAVLDPRFDLQRGNEVLVPAVSWPTTYYPLTQYGLRPVFVDVDVETLNVDLLEAAITHRRKAIFTVNLLGNPNDLRRLTWIAQDHSLVLLEDNCESLGAVHDGVYVGTAGLAGTFSSFFSRHIATMEGGVILTDDEQLYREMISLPSHGWTRELPVRNHVHNKTGDAGDDLFRFMLPGYNVRPLEMEGALGLEQLHSSWFGFSMVLKGALAGRRSEVVNAPTAAGIESRSILVGNFTRNPVMAHLDAIIPDERPAADNIHVDGVFIGNHHYPVHRRHRPRRRHYSSHMRALSAGTTSVSDRTCAGPCREETSEWPA